MLVNVVNNYVMEVHEEGYRDREILWMVKSTWHLGKRNLKNIAVD